MAKKQNKEENIDWKEIFNNYIAPKIYKVGLEDYIVKNNLQDKIKSQEDLDRIIKNFNKMTMG